MHTALSGQTSSNVGLTTAQALHILSEKLSIEVATWQRRLTNSRAWGINGIADLFKRHHVDRGSVVCCYYLSVQVICLALWAVAVPVSQGSSDLSHLVCSAVFLLCLVVANIWIDQKLSHCRTTELLRKADAIQRKVLQFSSNCDWNAACYASLFAPASESLSLQWTYRNGYLVNLPWILLVEGDVILLRPGREAPCSCFAMVNGVRQDFQLNEVYMPSDEAKSGKAVACIQCQLLETPAVSYVRRCAMARSRPASMLQNELFHTVHVYGERVVIPAFAVLALVLCSIRYVYQPHMSGTFAEMFLLYPANILTQLCCFVLQPYILLVNLMSMTSLLGSFARRKDCSLFGKSTDSVELFADSEETTELIATQAEVKFRKPWLSLCCENNYWKMLKDIVSGNPKHLIHSANLVQTLGSVTVLSIVDKKGILSWPNPTPEKLFFYHSPHPPKQTQKAPVVATAAPPVVCESRRFRKESVISVVESELLAEHGDVLAAVDDVDEESRSDAGNIAGTNEADRSSAALVEVLDFTHDPNKPFLVHFDDTAWKSYLDSLKPLGLNILLNSCDFIDAYTRFLDHMHVVSDAVPRTIAVQNRRCLCYLAKTIGFKPGALKPFADERRLFCAYRRTPGELPLPGLTKHRTPLANMFSVVSKDKFSGQLHCMNQGTADLVLDACDQFWDGRNVCTLSRSHRKKISDFYHRYSMTAYCLAFSYSPLGNLQFCGDLAGNSKELLLECPADLRHSSPHAWSSARDASHMAVSLDSLLADEFFVPIEIRNPDDCLRHMYSKHVFLGLMALQYQAKPDVVRMIEQLNQACIRFVHFSKENELRSRIFVEKMGLEAGWNCHISLSSEGSTDDVAASSGSRPSRRNTEADRRRRRRNALSAWARRFQRQKPADATQSCASLPADLKLDLPVVHFKCSPRFADANSNGPTEEKELVNLDENSSSSDSDNSAVALASRVRQGESAAVNPTSAAAETNSVITSNSSTTGGYCSSAAHRFILPNRAGMPKGIENVRPHLQQVDNVPLLVPLFTDCNSSTTREMIRIMQDYGEIVCVGGSSANFNNCEIFLQADVAISIEPLQPAVCAYSHDAINAKQSVEEFSPMHLTNLLSSLPCSLSIHSGQHISFLQLISESRHLLSVLRTSLLFLAQCSFCLVVVQLLALLLFLPPVLSEGQSVWLSCVLLPLLSLSLCATPMEADIVLKMATSKNQNWIRPTDRNAFVLSFCVKFLPTALMVVLLFRLSLHGLCETAKHVTTTPSPVFDEAYCGLLYVGLNVTEPFSWSGWSNEYRSGLTIAQSYASFMFVVYCVFISASFVHYRIAIWQRLPFNNSCWCVICCIVLLLQLLYVLLDNVPLLSSSQQEDHHKSSQNVSVDSLPFYVFLLGCVWPVILVSTVELLKRFEIRKFNVDKRRRKLCFGTKLGLNSPF